IVVTSGLMALSLSWRSMVTVMICSCSVMLACAVAVMADAHVRPWMAGEGGRQTNRSGADPALPVGAAIFVSRRARRANQHKERPPSTVRMEPVTQAPAADAR